MITLSEEQAAQLMGHPHIVILRKRTTLTVTEFTGPNAQELAHDFAFKNATAGDAVATVAIRVRVCGDYTLQKELKTLEV